MAEPVIKIEDVSVQFGKAVILNQVSLNILDGEIFGIVGMSGSGKTTLLKTIIGFIEPVSGDILYRFKNDDKFEYEPVRKRILHVRKLFGFAAQDPSFYLKLSVIENLKYFSAMYDLNKEVANNNIKTMLELVGLDHCQNLLAEQLSGGMKKRLDIACALVHNPEVLILDEPTADLDPLLREQMWELIKKINQKGTTIIIASHFLKEMEVLCKRVGILHKQKIDTVGTPSKIRQMYTTNEEIHLETHPGNYGEIIKELRKHKNLKMPSIENKGHELIIYTPDSITVLHHLLHTIEKKKEHLIDVDVNKPSLKEVFESFVKEK